ncbi:MAG TPA: ABC transporter substrate-binding protein, partial [Acidimicrobiales bacterium]|nr:ABC transporter substrate-binding protein [Acidimicrobiales bacterium]
MSETETTQTPASGPEPLAERPWPRVSRVRMAVPVILIVGALIAAGIVATVNESNTPTTATAPSTTTPTSSSSVPITYATAAKEGTTSSYDWGPQCDHHTGRLKMPTVYSPPCVPVPAGSNGGATSSGVTATTINLVYYYPQPGGLASTISSAAGTPAQALATVEAYVAMLNKIYVLYGRHVNLIPFEASGADTDPVAAHADAVTVAEQDHAFASIGGPGETTAYEQELARLHVLCIGCGDSSLNALIQQDAPYQWANLPTADTSLNETVDYMIAKLNGKDAIWAGDTSLHTQKRSFIIVSETSIPPAPGFDELTTSLEKKLRDGHVDLVSPADLTYNLNLTTLPTQAATLAEKLKSSGATSVVFAGDPIMPIYLTKACANIGYFPEWIITGIVLTDTSALGRYYDQSEWSHAFGVSSLAVPVPVAAGDADHLYRWWYGPDTGPASLAAPAILPAYQQFFTGVQLAGAHLTPQTFTEGLFRAPLTGGGPTTPLDAYGYQGAAPHPSYSS